MKLQAGCALPLPNSDIAPLVLRGAIETFYTTLNTDTEPVEEEATKYASTSMYSMRYSWCQRDGRRETDSSAHIYTHS